MLNCEVVGVLCKIFNDVYEFFIMRLFCVEDILEIKKVERIFFYGKKVLFLKLCLYEEENM